MYEILSVNYLTTIRRVQHSGLTDYCVDACLRYENWFHPGTAYDTRASLSSLLLDYAPLVQEFVAVLYVFTDAEGTLFKHPFT